VNLWLAVTAVAIFGTMSADFLNKNWACRFGVHADAPALQSTVSSPGTHRETLNIHSITTHRRELFYWLPFSLHLPGNSGGRFRAGPLGLGTLASTLVFLGSFSPPGWLESWGSTQSLLLAGLHHHPSPGCFFRRLLAVPLRSGTDFKLEQDPSAWPPGSCCSESSP